MADADEFRRLLKWNKRSALVFIRVSKSVGRKAKGSILHKTGYNYGIDGASKYYNPFYVT